MTAVPATIAGPCSGGCGRQVSREPAPGDNRFAEIANRLPLLCDHCATRYLAEEQSRRDAAAASQERIARRQRLDSSGLPLHLRHVDLDKLDPEGCADALEHAARWATGALRGLMLTGPFGTGKTTIAAGALRRRIDRAAGRWASAPNLMASLARGFGDTERARALDDLSGRRALVLDDLDKTRPTEYGAEQIFLAIDNSVTTGRALLVTTNLSAGQLAAKWPPPFGEAIASRIAGYCTAVTVAGADRRLTAGGRS